MTEQDFLAIGDAIQAAFDEVVDKGSDDELFYAGYLNGHFSLALSQCLLQQDHTLAALDQAMRQGLADAFAQGELEPAEQVATEAFWQTLFADFMAANA